MLLTKHLKWNLCVIIALFLFPGCGLIENEFNEAMYTGEFSPTKRTYNCSNNHEILVGLNEQIKTIEELKEKGCPVCGSKAKFDRVKTEKYD